MQRLSVFLSWRRCKPELWLIVHGSVATTMEQATKTRQMPNAQGGLSSQRGNLKVIEAQMRPQSGQSLTA
jgi:hypothetical protein